jgi:hypothetical protein
MSIRNKKSVPKAQIFLSPPSFLARPVLRYHVRTLATSPQIDAPVAYNQLSALVGIVATSAITSVNLTSGFRLKRIRIWAPAPFGSVATSVASVTWTESAADYITPPVTVADSSVNPSVPVFVDAKPPRGSLADKWHDPNQTNGICIMTYPAGSIVDFIFNYVLDDFGGPQASFAIAGGVTGTVYHRSFNSLLPQSVNPI